jgi:hypothetical protein
MPGAPGGRLSGVYSFRLAGGAQPAGGFAVEAYLLDSSLNLVQLQGFSTGAVPDLTGISIDVDGGPSAVVSAVWSAFGTLTVMGTVLVGSVFSLKIAGMQDVFATSGGIANAPAFLPRS